MVNELILFYGMQDDINNEKQKQSCSDFFLFFFSSQGGFRTKLLMEFGTTLSTIHTRDQQRAVVWQQCHQTLWLSTALANVSRMENYLPFYPYVHGLWVLIIFTCMKSIFSCLISCHTESSDGEHHPRIYNCSDKDKYKMVCEVGNI